MRSLMRVLLCRGNWLLLLLCLLGTSCRDSDSGLRSDLRGVLLHSTEDFLFDLCETGERLWVDRHAVEAWWPQISDAADGGGTGALLPPLFVDMTCIVKSNGPFGHAGTSRGVVEILTIRSLTQNVPSECAQ